LFHSPIFSLNIYNWSKAIQQKTLITRSKKKSSAPKEDL
jgi:hypothetical protein